MDRERIFEGWLDDESDDDEDEEQRKKKPAKDTEPEPEPGGSDEEHPEVTEVEPPPERPRRVPVAEVTATLPEAVRFRVEQALARHGGEWFLEKGRYLYTRLARTEVIKDNGHEVAVTERLALRRDEPPRLPEPARLEEIVKQVVQEPDRAEEFVSGLAGVDEIELRVQTTEGDRIIRIAPEPEPKPEPQRAERPESPEAVPDPPEASTAEVTPEVPKPDAPEPEPAESTEAAVEPEPPQVEIEEVAELVREVREEPEEAAGPGASEEAGPEPTPKPGPEPEPKDRDSGLPAGTEVEPAASEEMPLAEVIETIKEAADARSLEELPIIAGGSHELDEQPRRRRRRDEDEYEPVPLPRRKRKPAPSKDYERRLMEWERHYRSPEKKPDAKLKRQARKLIRALARRYGIRLTPETEAQLLGIMLAPRLIDGRKVYGLFVNIEEVRRVLETLWLHYPAAAPRVY